MAPARRILTVSRDPALQQSRTLLLEHAGYEVTALTSDVAVRLFLHTAHRPPLNLVLMCHTVPEKSRVLLCHAIKTRYPNTPILMLYNGYDPTAAEVDGRIENVHDPVALIDTLAMLLHPQPADPDAPEQS